MDISNSIPNFLQFLTSVITITSLYFVYKTIQSNKGLNQNNLFNEIVKQERELRVKLFEYRIEIDKRIDKKRNFREVKLSYDTLLFNFYEYLAICLFQKLIHEESARLYFKELLGDVKELFEHSLLFEEKYAERSQYKGIQWLLKKWDIKE